MDEVKIKGKFSSQKKKLKQNREKKTFSCGIKKNDKNGHFILFSFHRVKRRLKQKKKKKTSIQQSQSVIYFHLLVSFFLYFPDAELCVRCTVCWKSFKHPMSLTLHKDVHKENKTKCPVCARVFSRSYDMKSHLTRIHKIT